MRNLPGQSPSTGRRTGVGRKTTGWRLRASVPCKYRIIRPHPKAPRMLGIQPRRANATVTPRSQSQPPPQCEQRRNQRNDPERHANCKRHRFAPRHIPVPDRQSGQERHHRQVHQHRDSSSCAECRAIHQELQYAFAAAKERLSQRAPLGFPGDPIPVHQRDQRVRMLLRKLEDCRPADDSHSHSLRNVNRRRQGAGVKQLLATPGRSAGRRRPSLALIRRPLCFAHCGGSLEQAIEFFTEQRLCPLPASWNSGRCCCAPPGRTPGCPQSLA